MFADVSTFGQADPVPDICRGDLAIDASTALLYSAEAPLTPTEGLRDARAVWTHVPTEPERQVLIFLHGHNGYVTVDAAGRSRVPDWAARDEAARKGASAKKAAPLIYGLHRLGPRLAGKEPIVMVPEDSTLATGSFWAKEPAGQYADPARLGNLVADGLRHLACLRRPDGHPYLPEDFASRLIDAEPNSRPGSVLDRVYLCGHSGAGLPLEEAAGSALILPDRGAPADLWLFDCTYWSKVAGFVRFCDEWKAAGRLAGGRRDAARFVCVYRPGTQTEKVADALRGEIARAIGVESASLVLDHSPDNFEKEVRPALGRSGALFLRTHLPHDEIPTFFISGALAPDVPAPSSGVPPMIRRPARCEPYRWRSTSAVNYDSLQGCAKEDVRRPGRWDDRGEGRGGRGSAWGSTWPGSRTARPGWRSSAAAGWSI